MNVHIKVFVVGYVYRFIYEHSQNGDLFTFIFKAVCMVSSLLDSSSSAVNCVLLLFAVKVSDLGL